MMKSFWKFFDLKHQIKRYEDIGITFSCGHECPTPITAPEPKAMYCAKNSAGSLGSV
jgi:hypothetical protein